jgi:hypothetical protein
MLSRIGLRFAFVVLVASCSKSGPDVPRSATIAGKPTPDVLLAPKEIADAPLPIPTERPHSTEVVVSVLPPTPAPTVDVASIPNSDRPRDSEPKSLREQLVRCLTFTLSKQDFGPITDRHIVRVEVHARSSCTDLTFIGEQTLFEVRARDRVGNVVARQVGQFQSPIRPLGEAVTFVDIAATIDDRLEASIY